MVRERNQTFDLIFCEQELNHLTKPEILVFVRLCSESPKPGGTRIVHVLNEANPIKGAEALARNFDHYNTFTEYTLRLVLESTHFQDIRIIPLNLYLFYTNPFNWMAWAFSALLSFLFRATLVLSGNSNRLFTKRVASSSRKAE